MVFLDSGTIQQGRVVEKITEFKVWFMTPFGVALTLIEAQEACDKNDLPGATCIVPIAVARGATLEEPIMLRGGR